MRGFFKRIFDKTFLRFAAVGAVNTVFGAAVMFGCYDLLHLSYWVSTAANYVLGSVLSYFLNKRFTFENRERGPGTAVRFAVNIVVCYLLAYGGARPIVRRLLSGLPEGGADNAAMLVGMGLFVGLNYMGQRFFAFRRDGHGA